MAGVYIKGMKMPECCEDCKLFNMEYDACNYTNCSVGYEYSNKRMEDCPLVEVPDHGDLIDRDVLMKYKASAYDIYDHELYAVGTGTILRMPAVIPAERSEE